MIKFIRSLGKKVQTLFKKIFGRKNREPQEKVLTGDCWEFNNLGPGEIFIDGQSFGRVESITTLSKDKVSAEQQDTLYSIYGLGVGDSDGEINCGWVEIPSKPEVQKNFFSIPLTLLPKRYWCKTLLITLAANQPYEYQAVDMSQYEEKKLAHFIVGSTKSQQELEAEAEAEEIWDEEKNGPLWSETGWASAVVGEATLLHYEELGVWDIEYDE